MLEGLDAVEWTKLSHAYGKAKDIPALLRGLTNASAKKRASSIFMLGASICHQGSFYSATAPTVPFLLELVAAPRVKDRAAILGLLARLATLDDHEPLLLSGAPTKLAGKLPPSYKRALAAVRGATKTYVELLGAREAPVRSAAAFLLAWLPDSAKAAEPILRRALEREKDKDARVALALSLAYAARYLASTKHDDVFEALLSSKDVALSVAAGIALAHTHAGKVDAAAVDALASAAAKKRLVVKSAPWMEGDLALFATHVLAALPRTNATDEALLGALEAAGSSFAANVLVRRLFERKQKKKKEKKEKKGGNQGERLDRLEDAALAAITVSLTSRSAPQRRALQAIAKQAKDAFDGDVATGLGERGLPSTPTLLSRWLEGSQPRELKLLDRVIGKQTVTDLFVAAVKATGAKREAILQTLRDALTPEEQIDVAMDGLVEIDITWAGTISLELVWEAAPKVPKHLEATAALLRRKGVPKRVTETTIYEFPMCKVVVGAGLAAIALARKKTVDASVDELLQEAYGFWPRVRDALAALPMERREKWTLHRERDDQDQPSEGFKGAWPYWIAVPTTKIADRALEYVKGWRPKDPWDGPRKKYADPELVNLIAAFEKAGNKKDAARLKDALAKLP